MSDVAIRIEGLSKLYRLGTTASYKTLRAALVGAARRLVTRRRAGGAPDGS